MTMCREDHASIKRPIWRILEKKFGHKGLNYIVYAIDKDVKFSMSVIQRVIYTHEDIRYVRSSIVIRQNVYKELLK